MQKLPPHTNHKLHHPIKIKGTAQPLLVKGSAANLHRHSLCFIYSLPTSARTYSSVSSKLLKSSRKLSKTKNQVLQQKFAKHTIVLIHQLETLASIL